MLSRINRYKEDAGKNHEGKAEEDRTTSTCHVDQNIRKKVQANKQARGLLLTAQGAPQAGLQSRADYNGRIFDSGNISISSKSRLVDATLTAYKLLDSAFVNQRGNPNHLEERFKIQDTDKMIKEILGERARNTAPSAASRAARTSRAAPVQTMRGPSKFSVQPNAPNAKLGNPLEELQAGVPFRLKEHPRPYDQSRIVHEDLQANATMPVGAGSSAGPAGATRTFRIRRHSAHPVASRVRNRKKVAARALYDLLNIGSSKLEEQKLDERIYKIMEKLQTQRSPAGDEGIQSPGFPMFSSNTIQNLTINAQPPVNIGQYTQLTNNTNTQKSDGSHHSGTTNTSQFKSRQRKYLLELIRSEILPYMKVDGQSASSQQQV